MVVAHAAGADAAERQVVLGDVHHRLVDGDAARHHAVDVELLQREIFGPILPIRAYDSLETVIQTINAGARPLAIYPFSSDRRRIQMLLDRVMSGGVSVNEALFHVAQHDLPFGGVGESGMGHYHGREGFDTFSKLRPVFYQAPFSAIQLMFQPPYGARAEKIINWLIKVRG